MGVELVMVVVLMLLLVLCALLVVLVVPAGLQWGDDLIWARCSHDEADAGGWGYKSVTPR